MYTNYVKIFKDKKMGEGVRLDGRKGPIGKVVAVGKDFVIAQFPPNKIGDYKDKLKKVGNETYN